ncbi:hypothetical protein BSZ39_01545 [Bowdeniella nasicola]|uniref:HNH nuclease domain-containing protein n=1 Tax=Bowdeniella nasicola TaxID=208480 RepID=A0A1Q5Q527_9ACTO|nr:HNH endonuclease signature motif containing protein [Bowdeniella nasicola]OKL54891.1 hypothetical protein BSZ39_01545 [Bowdeniella nasicola]
MWLAVDSVLAKRLEHLMPSQAAREVKKLLIELAPMKPTRSTRRRRRPAAFHGPRSAPTGWRGSCASSPPSRRSRSIAQSIADSDTTETAADASRLEVPWLDVYGPISPAVAILLAAGGTWRRLVTDTLTGEVLDIGRTRYRPPAAIADAVRIRDRFCRGPGCTRTRNLELDHIKPWAVGGTTSVANLHLLCKRCHRLKTTEAARLSAIHADGSRTWDIGGISRHEPVRTPRRRRFLARPKDPPDDGEPPF